MKNGEQIWHKVHRVYGILIGTPRPHGSHCKVRLDGNLSALYYRREDIQLVGPDGTPLPEIATSVAASPAAVNGATPLTMGDLIAARNELRRSLDKVEDRLARLRLDEAVSEAIASIKLPAVTIPAATLPLLPLKPIPPADAAKIRADTNQALAAAERLIARGAL